MVEAAIHSAIFGTVCLAPTVTISIEGDDENVLRCTVLTDKDGETAAVFTTQKIQQYPPGYGIMC
jgi:hypothetical protein